MSGNLHNDAPQLVNFHVGKGVSPGIYGEHRLADINEALKLATASVAEHGGTIGFGTGTAAYALRFAAEVTGVEMYEEPRPIDGPTDAAA